MKMHFKKLPTFITMAILCLCCGCGKVTISFGDQPSSSSPSTSDISETEDSQNASDDTEQTKETTGKIKAPNSSAAPPSTTLNSPLKISSSKEIDDVIAFTTQFYTDWFEMNNYGYMEGNPDFKTYDAQFNMYSPNYKAFYEVYASQDADVPFPESYTMSLYDDMVLDSHGRVVTKHSPDKPPSAISSLVKSVDAIKVLSGGNGIYKMGVILTIEGEQVGTDLVVETQYIGTCTVVAEETGYKIEKYCSYIHSEQDTTDKPEAYLEAFKAKLLGKGSEIDVIKDHNVTASQDGVVVESTILLDENKDTSSSVDTTSLDIKQIIKENDPKTVTFLGPTSQGSGFIIAPGVVATNYHVIDGQAEGVIRFVDGSTTTVLGVIDYNPDLDLAILKLATAVGEPVSFGNADTCSKADEVLAIGSPLGLYNTVTVGLFNNTWEESGVTLLQSSLPLAPGNSGGPLFNSKDEVIGVNTMIMSGYADISLAVDIQHVINDTSGWQNTSYKSISAQPLSQLLNQ